MATATEAKVTEWTSCYEDGWKGYIVDEAFAHPAKMARGLLECAACAWEAKRQAAMRNP